MNAPMDFDRHLSAWLDAQAPLREPDGLFERTADQLARTSRLPAWRVPERWLPMPVALRLAVVPRAVILLLLLALLVALGAGALTVGSRLSLLPAVATLPGPVGLADNGLIAYDSAGDIWVANPDGADPRQLTTSPALEHSPAWSPDGTRLAYWSQAAVGAASDLVVARADGSGPVIVFTDEAGDVPFRTDWAPDGSRLAFSLCTDTADPCAERIFVVAADGSGSAQVGDPTLTAQRPDWSPDGSLLAFQGTPSDGGAGAYVMAPDGTGVRRLAQLPEGDDYNAFVVDWSPDGSGIVTQAGTPQDIWSIAAEGDAAVNLSDEPVKDDGVAWWSPDGAHVAYLRGMSELSVVAADGTGTRSLGVFPSGGFTWSPDATKLAMIGTGAVVILDAATGEALAEIPAPDQRYPAQAHYPSWQRVAP